MGAISLTDAQSQLAAWMAANIAVSKNQSYSIGDQTLTRADASKILDQVKYWRTEVDRLSAGTRGPRVFRALPRDL